MSSFAPLNAFTDIPDRMLWKDAARSQLEGFKQLVTKLGLLWEVVSDHTSKSVRLPVIRITCGNMGVYIHNFHDINVCVVAREPIDIPLSTLFEDILVPRDWDWYLGEVAKCRGYSWKGWEDREMNSPGTLSPYRDAPDHMRKSAEVKARWAERLFHPEWYHNDWTSGRICWEGEFGPGATLWVQNHAFLEGISKVVPHTAQRPYELGCSGFALAVASLEQVEKLVKRLAGSA